MHVYTAIFNVIENFQKLLIQACICRAATAEPDVVVRAAAVCLLCVLNIISL
jgi:hypothetical protein